MASVKLITSTLNQTGRHERVGAMLNSFETGDFKTVQRADCVTQYSQLFFTAHGDLILTVNDTLLYDSINGSTESYLNTFTSTLSCFDSETIMQDACISSVTGWNSSSWWVDSSVPLFSGQNVSQCLVESLPEHCKLQLSTFLAVAVIAANVVKIVAMLVTMRLKADPIMNLGDAISSFLQRPEASRIPSHSSERSQSTFGAIEEQESLMRPEDLNMQGRLRWHDAVSSMRWKLCMFP